MGTSAWLGGHSERLVKIDCHYRSIVIVRAKNRGPEHQVEVKYSPSLTDDLASLQWGMHKSHLKRRQPHAFLGSRSSWCEGCLKCIGPIWLF